MEGIFLVLVGAVLFSHAWYLLGLYTEGRSMGLINAALGVVIAAAAVTLSTVMLPEQVNGEPNPAVAPIQGYALLWAVYAATVAAHGLWNFEERAIGFLALFLWAASLVYVIAIPTAPFTAQQIPNETVWVLAGSSLVLGVLSALVFFHLAVPFREIRTVTGWFLLVGSVIVALLGFGVLFRLIGVA